VLEFVRSEVEVPKDHERMGSMNVGLRGSNIPNKPGQGGSGAKLGNLDDGAGTFSGVPRLEVVLLGK
jgi:hypothetical protein